MCIAVIRLSEGSGNNGSFVEEDSHRTALPVPLSPILLAKGMHFVGT